MKIVVLKNQKGQGLIEYLLIVALVAISSIAVISTVGGTVREKFAEVNSSLAGKKKNYTSTPDIKSEQLKRTNMGTFMNTVEAK